MKEQEIKRTISLKIIVAALIISLLIFASGVIIGLAFSQASTNSLSNELDSLQAQTSFLEVASQSNFGPSINQTKLLCPLYSSQLSSFDNQTELFRQKLDYLIQTRGLTDPSVLSLQSSYDYLQARDYLNIKRFDYQCGFNFNSVLFFYSPNCPDCDNQLTNLAQVKKQSNFSVFIYSFDGTSGQTAVNALKAIYNVSNSYPVTVINDKVLYGVYNQSEILSYLNQSSS